MNTADVAYARNLDLEAISKRLHHPDGPHMQDIETILYALHSLRDDGVTQAIHDDHLRHRTPA
jgi:hypothetical protein